MNMQQQFASRTRQVRHYAGNPARLQVRDLRHAFATTAKNAEKCSTAPPHLADGGSAHSARRTALQALLVACVAAAFCLQPATGLAAAKSVCQFADDAPDTHLVVRGDTLWDLASRFLRNPWCWPEVWEHNRDAVANPHWIYPGQTIRLDRARGLLTSGAGDDATLPVAKLTPGMRAEAITPAPVPLMASRWLSLLRRTPLMAEARIAQAPRIVALSAERRMAGAGDMVYVRYARHAGDTAQTAAPAYPRTAELRRALAPVIDPDTGKTIALATRRVGHADWLRGATDGLQTMRVTEASEEVMAGDLLVDVAATQGAGQAMAPHAAAPMRGRVAAILHDGRWATVHDIVALNRGTLHGLDAGSVVNVTRPVRIGHHESPQASSPSSGIDEPVATLLVVDVLEHAALAIVMRAQDPFTTGAAFASPEPTRP